MPLDTARRYAFQHGVIVANAPRSPGIYALFCDEQLCYVDEADNIYLALLKHFGRHNHAYVPTTFAFETSASTDRTARVFQLVFKHRPIDTARRELKARER